MLASLRSSFIDGQFVAAQGPMFALTNPATEEVFHEVHEGGGAAVEQAVSGAQRVWEGGWRDLAPGKRAAVLHKLAAVIEAHADELAELDSRSMGKPLAAARDEVLGGAATFRYYAGALTMPSGEVLPVGRGGFDFTLRQPMGVVAAIVPWNFPFVIACWKVAPALAAGNAVVLKPSGYSPLGALRLGQLALEAGVPAGVLQVVCGDGAEAGEALVVHPQVRKVSFTGSTATGREIMRKAAGDFKRLSLELGGKSPNIVFADADVEKAASTSPWAVFDNTGQDCCARSRVLVERPVYAQFLERFVAAAKEMRVGAPDDAQTQLGPLVSRKQFENVQRFLADARAQGSTFHCGGERLFDRGFYLGPTILSEVQPTDLCWREEIFGPVACVRPFDTEEEMLAEVNASPYGLSSSLWTRDLQRALRVSKRIEAGVVSINCHNSVHIEAPFGGWKHSGLGRDLGLKALQNYTEEKNIYVAE